MHLGYFTIPSKFFIPKILKNLKKIFLKTGPFFHFLTFLFFIYANPISSNCIFPRRVTNFPPDLLRLVSFPVFFSSGNTASFFNYSKRLSLPILFGEKKELFFKQSIIQSILPKWKNKQFFCLRHKFGKNLCWIKTVFFWFFGFAKWISSRKKEHQLTRLEIEFIQRTQTGELFDFLVNYWI